MSMNILAILLSLAMMLTGAGSEGQAAQASRTLVLHNVSLTYNDETVDLEPELILGAATFEDGNAVFDLGVGLGDEVLFPIQLGIGEAGLTALLKGEDVSARVSAKAIEDLTEQANAALEGMMSQAQDEMGEDGGALVGVLTNELIPAYTGLMEAVKDPEYAERVQKAGNAALEKIVDRGEGTPVTELIEGENYALTAYSYALENGQLAALADAVYQCDEKLAALYEAIFHLYAVLPEESGLNDVTSFEALFEMFPFKMRLDVEEKTDEAGDVVLMDGVMTMDMSDMLATMAQSEDGGEAELPEIEPMVMNIHSVKVDEDSEAEISCAYAVDGVEMQIGMNARSQGTKDMDMDFNMTLTQQDTLLGLFQMSMDASEDEQTGDASYSMSYDVDAQGVELDFDATGVSHPDGAAENRFSVAADTEALSFALSFDVDVTTKAIEDVANGHEPTLVLDDLSQEGLEALGQSEEAQAALGQAVGSLSGDVQKLMANESVQKLFGLIGQMSSAGYDYADDSFDMADDDYDYDYDDDYIIEEPEDDGVLPFEEPEFTWLPEGWSMEEKNVDTAYDMVDVTLTDKSGNGYIFAMFSSDMDDSQTNYLLSEDGSLVPVEGREVTVSDYDDGFLYVSLREKGVSVGLSVSADKLDLKTVGQLIAGLKF